MISSILLLVSSILFLLTSSIDSTPQFNRRFSAASVPSPSFGFQNQPRPTHDRFSHRNQPSNCGYDACHPTNPTSLNVHIVCHTHLDTGWVETYDEYYHRCQLEFISGGWSMNDEASAYYQDIIDQMTYGHKWLNETFGECANPKIGWQIDPFGHSREQASIFSQMSFDGLFLGRIDYQDKELRERTQTLEMVWKSSPSLGQRADIFTGVLPNVYWPPKGFCWDANCWDEPLHEQNTLSRAREFIRHAKTQAANYGTNHTIITMGMDFYFRDADKWYRNLDRLIQAVNSLESIEGVHMMYSTPSCYLKSLHDLNKRWPTKLDDFFPYADAFNTYWTGYFTSRPSLKYHIRYSNNILQVAKQLHALVGLSEKSSYKLKPLQEVLGIMQHHDAVTGTCKQYVSNDYTHMMTKAINTAQEAIVEAYDRLWIKEGFIPTTSLTFCNLLNSSRCDVTEQLGPNNDVVVIVYNPVAHPVKHYVRLPIGRSTGHRVRDALGSISASQIVPNHEAISNLPDRPRTSMDSELVFRVMLPPLGFTSIAIDRTDPRELEFFYVTLTFSLFQMGHFITSTFGFRSRAASTNNHLSQVLDGNQFDGEVTISNTRMSVSFDPKTGLMTAVTLKDGSRVPLSQNFYIYDAEGRKMGEKPSGAYAFNPSPYKPRPATAKATIKVIRGPLVEEIHQSFNPWISQVIRVYQHVDYIEFDWIVGPIPIDNWFFDPGQEVVSKFDTFLQTNGTFFTDSNGRETLRRVRDHRPTWELDTTERVASNYYPITSWMFIRDYEKDLQLTVLPDRPQGGSSIEDGSVELMVHRRLTMDDGFGVDEALNEPGEDGRGLVARGKHRVVIGDIQESVRQMRMMTKSLSLKPVMAFRKRDLAYHHRSSSTRASASRALANSKFIGLNRKLPPNLNLLTLEPWTDDRILLRLEHIFEVNEDPKYSRPRRISLRDLFTPFIIVEAVEMNLAANVKKRVADAKRFRWFPQVDPYANYSNVLTQLDSEDIEAENSVNDNALLVTFYPMEIKTFLVRTVERTNCTYTGAEIHLRNGTGSQNNWRKTPNC